MQRKMAEQEARLKEFEATKSPHSHVPPKPPNPLEAQLAEMQRKLYEQDQILQQYRGSASPEGDQSSNAPSSAKPAKPSKPSNPAAPSPHSPTAEKPNEPDEDATGTMDEAIDNWLDDTVPIVMPDGCKVHGI